MRARLRDRIAMALGLVVCLSGPATAAEVRCDTAPYRDGRTVDAGPLRINIPDSFHEVRDSTLFAHGGQRLTDGVRTLDIMFGNWGASPGEWAASHCRVVKDGLTLILARDPEMGADKVVAHVLGAVPPPAPAAEGVSDESSQIALAMTVRNDEDVRLFEAIVLSARASQGSH